MGRLLYVIVGGCAGVALSENKELVGQCLFSALTLAKSAATTAQSLELQGTKLSEVPVLGSLLAYVSKVEVDAAILQKGVDTASALSKEAVRSVGSNSSQTQAVLSLPPSNTSSSSSSYTVTIVSLGLVGGGVYCAYDPVARRKAIEVSRLLQAYLERSLEESKFICQRASRDAPIYYERASKEVTVITNYAKEKVPKITATVVGEVQRHISSTQVIVRTHAPRIYRQVRQRCDTCYVEAKTAVEKLLANKQSKPIV
uniref:Uncharacterized protein n=1 Tax=Hemiselmis andersenii TaxID=464988 RepID=A0A6U2A8M9_HEMAN|mmetsp:Transcript_10178/g.23799  ORF Transcript_10178/g.23799 Transcript_10178/m.23799 type:complete len:257 (+) Transcript_10178:232-1002(+)|eukprot:CAMPEP_0114126710 /NCGR_PEP_ID=MMETSP0043_2-20121206/9973_1 /TAXON_ID=464988 /ORGANISM="Hemiselmis andersenii, Strain CCMP644" /LENGTH=256 /DNA_ID=CAMNT_0001219709 /DNA_START=218 /DNA_END=988 /DNA_ORIENTATION=-